MLKDKVSDLKIKYIFLNRWFSYILIQIVHRKSVGISYSNFANFHMIFSLSFGSVENLKLCDSSDLSADFKTLQT